MEKLWKYCDWLIYKVQLSSGSFNVRKRLVTATLLSILDYGDLMYINAFIMFLWDLLQTVKLWRIMRIIFSGWMFFFVHSEVWTLVHFNLQSTLRLLLSSIGNLITWRNVDSHCLRSNDFLLLSLPFVGTELCTQNHSVPSTWNKLQKDWKLSELLPLNSFNSRLRAVETTSSIWDCFN